MELNISISWPAAMIEQNPRLAEAYDAPTHTSRPYPTFAIHRQIADFVESNAHEDWDVLAFQAAGLFFQSSEELIGCGPYATLLMRFADQRPLLPGSPRPNRSYKYSAQWHRSLYRQAHKAFKTEGASSQVFIALGSNMGDRIGMIEQACAEMARRGLKVRRTSSLYETEAMYETNQPPFVNGACEIETTLPPTELLDQLKDIEKTLGRVKTVENGPRNIDLDILLYDNRIVNEERLQIPHPRISEREFVLRPLCE
ncbi:MAG: hypothetical protein Q9182_004919 [Xanthomendoza sp. 2 TL-2023]